MTSLNSSAADNAPSESMAAEERLGKSAWLRPKVVKTFGAQPFRAGSARPWNMQTLHFMV
nr:hypothetical protein [Yersinia enterocolitica]